MDSSNSSCFMWLHTETCIQRTYFKRWRRINGSQHYRRWRGWYLRC